MTVYVDDAFIPAKVRSGARVHDSRWCHMKADTTEELVAMAKSIGLQESYIQFPGTWKEHFDVTEPKRRQAIAKGAVEVGQRERIKEMGERRMRELESQP